MKTPKDYARVMFHVKENLLPDIAARTCNEDPTALRSGSAYGATVRRDVVRYYNLLRNELAMLRLTQAEALAACTALHPLLPEIDARFLWKDLARICPALARKRPTLAQSLAIVDAVERLYRRHKAPSATALREVGLLHQTAARKPARHPEHQPPAQAGAV